MKGWVLPALLITACSQGRPATAADCQAIFAQIVQVELIELGYRDPTLVVRRVRELAVTLRAPLVACEGRQVTDSMLHCVKAAKTTEEISHSCLGSK